jgi:hypothetical protein
MGEVFFLLKTPLFSGKEAETGEQKVREKERERRDPSLKKDRMETGQYNGMKHRYISGIMMVW